MGLTDREQDLALRDIDEHLDRAVEFPADREAVIEAVGDRSLRAPTGTTASVRESIDRSNEETFASVWEATATIRCFLDEDFVGRKYYDDRCGCLDDPRRRQRSL
ncbi:MAG: hypothetical protein ABEJ86_01670 [Halococcoides sp.]